MDGISGASPAPSVPTTAPMIATPTIPADRPLESNPQSTPMTRDERKALVAAARTPAASATQVMGVLLGLGAVIASFVAWTGNSALDPTTFTEYVVALGVLALAFAAASKTLQKDVIHAIRRGVVLELRGVPSRSDLPGAIDIGGVNFCGGVQWIKFVREGSLNFLSYVEIGSPVKGKLRVMVLGVNDQQFRKAELGFVSIQLPQESSGMHVGAALAVK